MATAKRKELKVLKVDNTSLFGLGYEGGGELPDELKGAMWTSPVKAEKAAQAYLTSRG